MHQVRCLPVEAFQEGNQLGRTGFQLQQKRRFFHRSSVSRANSSDHVYLTSTYIRCCLQFRELGGFAYREWNVFGRLRQALVHIQTTNKRSRPPTSTVLDILSTVSARAGYRSVRVSWYARFTRVHSNNLSTQLRRTQTSSTVSPPVPTTVVADPKRSADSEQIRVATIALHTEQENTRNLQEAQVYQRRTLSFLVG